MSAFDIVRHPRARTLKLAFDPVTGRARLTLPRRAALGPALAWAQGKEGWIAAQRARLPQARPFAPGAVLPVADEPLTIDWTAGSRRTVRREKGRLSVEGAPETLPRRIETWLRREALDLLSRETAEFAALAGVAVSKVAVGDPKGRWGSCASSGVIRYSWRLLLAPGFVRRATWRMRWRIGCTCTTGLPFTRLPRNCLARIPAPRATGSSSTAQAFTGSAARRAEGRGGCRGAACGGGPAAARVRRG